VVLVAGTAETRPHRARQVLHQPASRGLVDDILAARHLLHDDGFVLHDARTVTLGSLGPLVKEYGRTRPEALILTGRASFAQEAGFVYADDDGMVYRVEGLRHRPGPLARPMTGVLACSPLLFQALHSVRPGWDRRLEPTDALQWLVERGYAVRAQASVGFATQVNTIDDLLAANAAVLDQPALHAIDGEVDAESVVSGAVTVNPGARIARSRIRGPAVVGPDVVVTGSALGPHTSLGAGCSVHDADISRSIVLPGASIRAVRVRDSVVGGDAQVEACWSTRLKGRAVRRPGLDRQRQGARGARAQAPCGWRQPNRAHPTTSGAHLASPPRYVRQGPTRSPLLRRQGRRTAVHHLPPRLEGRPQDV
jgi:glucose-1-phosphate thymidylyltransferase